MRGRPSHRGDTIFRVRTFDIQRSAFGRAWAPRPPARRSPACHSRAARREEVEELRKLTAEEVQRFYAANLLPSSPTRRKLSVHVVGRAHLEQLGRAAPTNVQLIGDPATLKHEAQRVPPLLGQP